MTPAIPGTSATTPRPEAAGPGAGALALTLAPAGAEGFLSEHWERRPLLVERGEAGRFDGVLSTSDAERLACSLRVRVPAMRMVRDGAQVPLPAYTEDVPWRPGRFAGMPVPERVAEEFAAGATLVLQALHLHWHPAAVYCRGLEMALGCPVQANAYWTPASAQGFAVHHDTHDVFVLQVAGRKRWRVYEPVLELPGKDQRWSKDLGAVGDPVMDFVLKPGDTLYLPRGWPHEAETSDEESLHLTIGLHPPTRLDAVRAALAEAGADVELRRGLGAGGDLPEDALERLAGLLAPERVSARARRRFVMSRRAILPDQLSQVRALGSLAAGTPVRRRETVIADLEGGVLRFEGKEVELPSQARVALEAIHATWEPFTAADLPGPLDEAGRLVLLRRLVREGYLRLDLDAAAPPS